ncbi:DUF1840 domain-containing protein [Verminephrobacter aporrectodeae]|uniref:DUF1840 domain-containing protein n=1 Tax=Verminephrobacter aporrectodeae TaxID=1110389 RepID=UPI00023750BE|nr:DUF1840 domain-containing protein [Verminephrobacter aporrectodeae]
MLYRFKSRAAAELIMLEPQGRRILAIIGKTPGADGIVTAAQIPAAIAALQAAVAADEERPPGPDLPDAPDAAETEERAHTVGLRQRAAPFIELLRRSAAQDADVVWAV